MKLFTSLILLFSCVNAAWVMFNDGEDTYIYNNVSGDIYIRHKKGGNNYEDVFVKMPSGVVLDSKHLGIDNKDHTNHNNSLPQDILLNKLQGIQNETLNRALE